MTELDKTYYKVEELVEGNVYKCRLSGDVVLKVSDETLDGAIKCYNKELCEYYICYANDFQLTNL